MWIDTCIYLQKMLSYILLDRTLPRRLGMELTSVVCHCTDLFCCENKVIKVLFISMVGKFILLLGWLLLAVITPLVATFRNKTAV